MPRVLSYLRIFVILMLLFWVTNLKAEDVVDVTPEYIQDHDVNQDGVANFDDVQFLLNVAVRKEVCPNPLMCNFDNKPGVQATDALILAKRLSSIYDLNFDHRVNYKDAQIILDVVIKRISCPPHRVCDFDLNGDNIAVATDALLLIKYIQATENIVDKLDMNGDSIANLDDALYLLGVAVKINTCLPSKTCDLDESGDIKATDAAILLSRLHALYDLDNNGILNQEDIEIALKVAVQAMPCPLNKFCNFNNSLDHKVFASDALVLAKFLNSYSFFSNNLDFNQDGFVNIKDSEFLLEVAVKKAICPVGLNCDFDNDGRVNATDALKFTIHLRDLFDLNNDRRVNHLDVVFLVSLFEDGKPCPLDKFCSLDFNPDILAHDFIRQTLMAIEFQTPVDHLDMNGDLIANLDDVKYLLDVAVGNEECVFSKECDVNQNGEVTATDALALLLEIDSLHDINLDGIADEKDVHLLLRIAVRKKACPGGVFCNLNNSLDNKIRATDALVLARYIEEKEQVFNLSTPSPTIRFNRRNSVVFTDSLDAEQNYYKVIRIDGKKRHKVKTLVYDWTERSAEDVYHLDLPAGKYQIFVYSVKDEKIVGFARKTIRIK